MAHIKINFEELNQREGELKNLIAAYEKLNSRTTVLTEQINAGWQGEASKAYLEMMQKYCQQAQKMVGILTAFKEYATGVATDFSEADQQCASWIRDSF